MGSGAQRFFTTIARPPNLRCLILRGIPQRRPLEPASMADRLFQLIRLAW